MTIATGILCSDGVVLCADSLETFRYSKTYGPKIFELQLPQQPFKVVLTGAGDSVFIDALQDKMTSALSLNIGGTKVQDIEKAIEEVIVNYHSLIWPLYPTLSDKPRAELLIGISGDDGFSLLHSDGPIVKKAKQVQCVGIGEEFCVYQLKRLLRSPYRQKINRVRDIAIYCMALTKDNIDGCGGTTHALSISKGGVNREGNVEETEAKFKAFGELTDRILARASSLKFGEDKILAKYATYYDGVSIFIGDPETGEEQEIPQFVDGKGGKKVVMTSQQIEEYCRAIEVLASSLENDLPDNYVIRLGALTAEGKQES